jgi:putative GTP pyrophosphokinase
MAKDSIYGDWKEILPMIQKELIDRIEGYREEEKALTGIKVYEHFESRIKTEDSMREKCDRKGLPQTAHSALRELKDSIGVRIVCDFIDDVYRNISYIEKMEGVTIVERKDYIRHAKQNGYRSYHMILDLESDIEDVDGNTPGHYYAEVQIRTIAMDTWASLEHEMKYKKTIRNQKLIEQELKRVADELASCDVSMQTIRELIRENAED